MIIKIQILLLVIILPLLAAAQAKDDLAAIQKLGQQCVTATIDGDSDQLISLTYPKVVEKMGGKAKMREVVEDGTKQMKMDGFSFFPTTVNAPSEVQKVGTKCFAVLTYQLKMKTPKGILKRNSFLLGIVDKPGDSWTFVDGTNLDEAKLKVLFPEAVGKLKLPPPSQFVLEKTP